MLEESGDRLEHEAVAILEDVHGELSMRKGDGVEGEQGDNQLSLLSFSFILAHSLLILSWETCKYTTSCTTTSLGQFPCVSGLKVW